MKMNWIEAAHQLSKRGEAYVLVTLVAVRGSTPRDGGTKMVVCADSFYDTIGGGHLEHKCIAEAHELLANQTMGQQLKQFNLGASLGQCCGGQISVLFEYFPATSVNIVLFGAGHVGQALVNILATLPCKISWVDSREEQFPSTEVMGRYNNVTQVITDCPDEVIEQAGQNSYFIVMTHDHQLDFDICQTVLLTKPFKYLGLIASATKWRRFQQRFSHREIDPALVTAMSCPIGSGQVRGKHPAEIAVSVAAEIIATYQSDVEASEQPPKATSVPWRELKSLLSES